MRAGSIYEAIEKAVAKVGAYKVLKCRNCVIAGPANDTTGPELACRLDKWQGGTPLEFINARDSRVARRAALICRDCPQFKD